MRFEIGTAGTAPLVCDLKTLVDTRLLVQANSGGGKSWALRRILEQTHGHVQHLVIDPEGEFATLRERFDYVLAARNGGETAADPRSAKLLAERLLELGVSAVLDIYELKAHERIAFVRAFLETIVDAPKRLWHPALVILDEAHVFAPENGKAESAGAVIDLATRGRKRGYCLVPATQRLSKLHKDVAAECNNKLIGRTGLDIDVKRAADELGFARERWRELRDLNAGSFFAYGPALARGVTAVDVGPVTTSHPKAGARLAHKAPPPTAKVRALLPQLADLPAEAEQRQRTVDDLTKDVQRLTRELAAAKRAQPEPTTAAKAVEVSVLTDADRRRLEAATAALAALKPEVDAAAAKLTASLDAATQALATGLERALVPFRKALEETTATIAPIVAKAAAAMPRPRAVADTPVRPAAPSVARRPSPAASPAAGDLTGPERRILNACAWLESLGQDTPRQVAVAFLAGYTYNAGAWNNPRGSLRAKGLLEYAGEGLRLTDAGRALAEHPDTALTTATLHARVLERLPTPEQRVLRPILERYPAMMTVAESAELAGYTPGVGAYNNPRGRLRSLGLIEYPEPGHVRAAAALFLEPRAA